MAEASLSSQKNMSSEIFPNGIQPRNLRSPTAT